MTENIKQFLHTWCSQAHKPAPVYNIVNQGGRGNQRLRFNCEITVEGYTYTGYGSSTNKKDAQTNAARDFVNFMVRENIVTKQSVPEFRQSELTGQTDEVTERAPVPPAAAATPTEAANPDQSNSNAPANYFTNILDQKRLEEAEGVDFTADIHGNWSLDNAKARLHQYMQQNKIQAEYKYSSVGPDHHKSFVCELTIFCNQLKKNLNAREPGSNKQLASKACALSIVRQMFHLGVLEAFGGVSKKIKSDQIPPFKVTISPDIKNLLNDVVNNLGLQPKQKPECENNEEINMVVNYTIADFEPQTHHRPQVIPWSPAMPNWNAWMSCNIDEGEQAFLSLDEMSMQLRDRFNQSRSSNQIILQEREKLPAAAYEEEIINAVYNNQIVLIRGETGSGKTTQVPQFLMDYHIQNNKGAECNIIVTQPRRISAITLAERVAQERGEMIGQSCGYSVRFETVYPQPYGGLLYCTVGTLLRKMEAGLRGISHLIVDEIHERDLNTDFLMILLKDMSLTYPQLKIILMSATIDVELFKNFFPRVHVVEIEGRTFPVNYFFLEDCIEMLNFRPDQTIRKDKKSNTIDFTDEDTNTQSLRLDDVDINCNAICSETYKLQTKISMSQLPEKEISFELIEVLLKYIETIHPDGSVLIFLPGWNIIQMLLKSLSKHPVYGSHKFMLLPLHSQVPRVDQKKVFQPCRPGVRKIILATNIAESSITINDVMFVIDSCRAKVKMFTSRNNLTSYNTVWASKTNLEQRRGRAGRVCEGYAFHLCSRARYERLENHQTPEILRTALHDLALMIKLLKLGDTKEFLSRAIEQPPIDAIIEAEHLLKEMKAFDKNDELTPLGRILARLPIEPRMGKMIIFGCLFGVGDACATIAACTSLGDPLVIPPERKRLSKAQVDLAGGRFSDHVAMLNSFQKWNSVQKRGLSEETYCESKGLSLSILKMSKDAASQMKSILVNTGFSEECLEPQFFNYDGPCPLLNTVTTLLVLGLYPNVCYHKEKRKVLTTESKPALVHKSSVNCSNFVDTFPLPFFIFGEKIRTRAISCKQMSMINPLQLLIFGSRKVVYQNNMIIVDDWLSLDMEFELAAQILALRPALEGLMVKVCMNPDIVMNPDDYDQQIMNIVTELSSPNVCFPEGFIDTNANSFNNRKRKPFNNQGVPSKFRAFDRSNTNFNTPNRALNPNFTPQRSFERTSAPTPPRPNMNNRFPFVKQPNSSFIRNQFVNKPQEQFNNNNFPREPFKRSNSSSSYLLETPDQPFHNNYFGSSVPYHSQNYGNDMMQPPRQQFRGSFNNNPYPNRPMGSSKWPPITGNWPPVTSSPNNSNRFQNKNSVKNYEMNKYNEQINRQKMKFNNDNNNKNSNNGNTNNYNNKDYESGENNINYTEKGGTEEVSENPCDYYDNVCSSGSSYNQNSYDLTTYDQSVYNLNSESINDYDQTGAGQYNYENLYDEGANDYSNCAGEFNTNNTGGDSNNQMPSAENSQSYESLPTYGDNNRGYSNSGSRRGFQNFRGRTSSFSRRR